MICKLTTYPVKDDWGTGVSKLAASYAILKERFGEPTIEDDLMAAWALYDDVQQDLVVIENNQQPQANEHKELTWTIKGPKSNSGACIALALRAVAHPEDVEGYEPKRVVIKENMVFQKPTKPKKPKGWSPTTDPNIKGPYLEHRDEAGNMRGRYSGFFMRCLIESDIYRSVNGVLVIDEDLSFEPTIGGSKSGAKVYLWKGDRMQLMENRK